ncbi:MAG: hypothetical protein ACYTGH_16820 [Planctomycetota bacterium]
MRLRIPTLVLALLAALLTGSPTRAAETAKSVEECQSYKVARDFLRQKKFDLAEPLLKVARQELPESIEVLSASAYCAESLAKADRALVYFKQILRYSLDGREMSAQDRTRVETARTKLTEMEPVSAVLLRYSLLLQKEAEALKEGADPDQVLLMQAKQFQLEAIGRDSAERRTQLARRAHDQAEKLRAAGKYEEAIARIARIEFKGVELNLDRKIQRMARVLRQEVQAERNFVAAAKKWNAYVAFTRDQPGELDKRNKLLWALKRQVSGTAFKRMQHIENLVGEEMIVVDNEMMKKERK